MGHNRVGRLRKTRRWSRVVEAIREDASAADVAQRTLHAAESQLRTEVVLRPLSDAFWMLVRLTTGARESSDFSREMAALGLDVDSTTPAPAFIARVADVLRGETRDDSASGHFSEIASLAVRRVLTEAANERQPSLFTAKASDIQASLSSLSTKAQFSRLAQRFFGDVLARTLTAAVDREVPNATGDRFTGTDAAKAFTEDVERHARESAFIVKDYAGDWYSKKRWESGQRIGKQDSDTFVAYALTKLRRELRFESTAG